MSRTRLFLISYTIILILFSCDTGKKTIPKSKLKIDKNSTTRLSQKLPKELPQELVEPSDKSKTEESFLKIDKLLKNAKVPYVIKTDINKIYIILKFLETGNQKEENDLNKDIEEINNILEKFNISSAGHYSTTERKEFCKLYTKMAVSFIDEEKSDLENKTLFNTLVNFVKGTKNKDFIKEIGETHVDYKGKKIKFKTLYSTKAILKDLKDISSKYLKQSFLSRYKNPFSKKNKKGFNVPNINTGGKIKLKFVDYLLSTNPSNSPFMNYLKKKIKNFLIGSLLKEYLSDKDGEIPIQLGYNGDKVYEAVKFDIDNFIELQKKKITTIDLIYKNNQRQYEYGGENNKEYNILKQLHYYNPKKIVNVQTTLKHRSKKNDKTEALYNKQTNINERRQIAGIKAYLNLKMNTLNVSKWNNDTEFDKKYGLPQEFFDRIKKLVTYKSNNVVDDIRKTTNLINYKLKVDDMMKSIKESVTIQDLDIDYFKLDWTKDVVFNKDYSSLPVLVFKKIISLVNLNEFNGMEDLNNIIVKIKNKIQSINEIIKEIKSVKKNRAHIIKVINNICPGDSKRDKLIPNLYLNDRFYYDKAEVRFLSYFKKNNKEISRFKYENVKIEEIKESYMDFKNQSLEYLVGRMNAFTLVITTFKAIKDKELENLSDHIKNKFGEELKCDKILGISNSLQFKALQNLTNSNQKKVMTQKEDDSIFLIINIIDCINKLIAPNSIYETLPKYLPWGNNHFLNLKVPKEKEVKFDEYKKKIKSLGWDNDKLFYDNTGL